MNIINEITAAYLKNKSPCQLSEEDKKSIIKTSLAEWITAKLVSGKFRKAPLAPKTRQDIYGKVADSIKKQEPIYLIICFGGYKHYWNPSHPNVDWAEMFNLQFMLDYVRPVLKAYPPGVKLDYEAEDFILPQMNNYPEEKLDAYADSFQGLLNFLKPVIPGNFQINYVRAKNQYNTSYVFDRLDARVEEKMILFDKLPIEQKEILLHKTEQNIMWKGKKDLTRLTSTERNLFIKRSRCTDEAFLEIDFEVRKEYFVGNNHISLVLSWGTSTDNIDHWLTIGSTYSSCVDFWIGRGIVEDRGNKIVPRIISHTQYDLIKDKLTLASIDNIPLPNFRSVEVYQGSFNP
jgi:hypothetical protein